MDEYRSNTPPPIYTSQKGVETWLGHIAQNAGALASRRPRASGASRAGRCLVVPAPFRCATRHNRAEYVRRREPYRIIAEKRTSARARACEIAVVLFILASALCGSRLIGKVAHAHRDVALHRARFALRDRQRGREREREIYLHTYIYT